MKGENTMNRYLRQTKSGTIYAWTPTLAKRSDMVEIDVETAELRIEAQKSRLKARMKASPELLTQQKDTIQKLTAISKELTGLEEVEAVLEKAEKVRLRTEISAISDNLNPDDIIKTEKPLTAEELKELERANKLMGDKEYQSISAMNTVEELGDYLKANYGILPPKKASVPFLKNMAQEQRERRIFEV